MTADEINIEIAKACGLNPVTVPVVLNQVTADRWFTPAAAAAWRQCYPNGASVKVISNYTADLNSIHEAEKVLTYSQKADFTSRLYRIVPDCYLRTNHDSIEFDELWALCHATAAQRAEAFLRCLSLWKE